MLRDLDEGYANRIAIVVPPGAVRPLPAYELALITAGQAIDMGHDDVRITVVTPESGALSLFGDEARAAADEMAREGVEFKTGVGARRDKDGLVLEPGGECVEAQRVFAVPRLLGPAIDGLPAADEGFILAGDDGRVQGCERTWAAGDAVVSPLKFGGLATHQARRAAAAIARRAGVEDPPDPGEPIIHGRRLAGRRTRRLRGRGDAEGAPLWWPQGRRWSSTCRAGSRSTASLRPPPRSPGRGDHGPPPAQRSARREVEYLRDLAREFRSADPAIAALGRHMRQAREH